MMGQSTCQKIAGCFVAGEVCPDDMHCCSGICRASVDGVLRCQALSGCSPAGDRCAVAGNCCSGSCAADPSGVTRCTVGSCRALGDRCMKPSDCCNGVACRAGLAPTMRCLDQAACRGDGMPCAAPDECCSQRCVSRSRQRGVSTAMVTAAAPSGYMSTMRQ
jgi:hypothetical protein